MTEYIDVDVRPILRAGGEPFSVIMAALDRLEPGQGLRLTPPSNRFRCSPSWRTRDLRIPSGRSTPANGKCCLRPAETKPAAAPVSGKVDLRRLAGTERQARQSRPRAAGADGADPRAPPKSWRRARRLSALLRREPVFLFPQLEKRGYRWLGGFLPDGATYELTVRAPS